MQKILKKNKKDSKNHNMKNIDIDPTDIYLVDPIWKKKISSFFAVNLKKCIIPPGEWLKLKKLQQMRNEKLNFSPTFQKIKSNQKWKKFALIYRLFSLRTRPDTR